MQFHSLFSHIFWNATCEEITCEKIHGKWSSLCHLLKEMRFLTVHWQVIKYQEILQTWKIVDRNVSASLLYKLFKKNNDTSQQEKSSK